MNGSGSSSAAAFVSTPIKATFGHAVSKAVDRLPSPRACGNAPIDEEPEVNHNILKEMVEHCLRE